MMMMGMTLLLLVSLLTCSSSMGSQPRLPAHQAQDTPDSGDEILTVAFCEMINHPQLYFEKTLRLTATYRVGFEAAYLIDEQCVLSYRVKIGVGFVSTGERQRDVSDVIRGDVDKIMSGAYGSGRARVTVVGVLRNLPDRTGFGGYKYRFDIMRFEDISREEVSQTLITYEGTLQAGKIYRATVTGDRRFGLSLVPPLRVPIHHAARIEWTNLGEFRALRRLRNSSRERQIVFSVISDEIKHMTERRWNRTLRCEVILVE
jgi:hypothetical protein